MRGFVTRLLSISAVSAAVAAGGVLAIEQLQEHLPSGSPMTGEGPTLDGAMAYLKRHTPTA